MRGFIAILFTVFALSGCSKNHDEEVRTAVQSALAEEKAKQAELEAIKQANEKQIQERVKEEVQRELKKQGAIDTTKLDSTPTVQSVPVINTVSVQTKNIGYIMTQKDGYVYLRNGANAEAKKIRKLNDGTIINILECYGYEYRADVTSGNHGSWCLVETQDGLQGYVFNSYIRSGTP